MVRRNAKRDIEPMPYAATEGPPRPRTMSENEIIVAANVPTRAISKSSPELSGNFFWPNDKPWIQPRLQAGLNENSLLLISTNGGKLIVHTGYSLRSSC